jgi:hypothetical protein
VAEASDDAVTFAELAICVGVITVVARYDPERETDVVAGRSVMLYKLDR